MDNISIEDGNAIIANFMKLQIELMNYGAVYRYTDGEVYRPSELKYHTSWDWLMPVITKIKDLILNNHPYDISIDKVDVLNLYITASIETVWEQTVYFIQWYNSNKTT